MELFNRIARTTLMYDLSRTPENLLANALAMQDRHGRWKAGDWVKSFFVSHKETKDTKRQRIRTFVPVAFVAPADLKVDGFGHQVYRKRTVPSIYATINKQIINPF